eukprot:UN23796
MTALIASIDFTVILPTIYGTLQEMHYGFKEYSLIFVVWQGTEFLSGLLLSIYIDCNMNIFVLVSFCTLCFLVGNVCYIIGVSRGILRLLLFGRCISGIGDGFLELSFALFMKWTKCDVNRERSLSYLRYVISIGSTCGPLISLSLT